MQLFFHENIAGGTFELYPEESKHMAKVLRKSIGDQVYFTNGRGSLFTCRIEDINHKKCRLSVIDQEFRPLEDFHIHLAIAPTKNADRMEWMLEKITEIGFHEITFLKTENVERNQVNLERLHKKLISACKQSIKTWLPLVNGIIDYNTFIWDKNLNTFQKFIAYVDENIPEHLINMATPTNSYVVLVGPEGDFGPGEIENAIQAGFHLCSLGSSRLRTETAGMVAVHSLNLLNFKKS